MFDIVSYVVHLSLMCLIEPCQMFYFVLKAFDVFLVFFSLKDGPNQAGFLRCP